MIVVDKNVDLENDKISYKLQHKKYNQKSFSVNKEQFAKLGYTNIHVLHDPTLEDFSQPIDTDSDNSEELSKKAEELSKREAELQKREDEIAKREAALDKGEDVFDVDTAKLDELKEFANDNGIVLGEATKVKDVREAIKKWLEANAQQ